MTMFNTVDYDIATTSNMVFDEVFSVDDAYPNCLSPTIAMDTPNVKKCISHSDSPTFNDQQHQTDSMMPDIAPLSPCFSEESSSSSPPAMSITGRYSNIEYMYHVDARVIGSGHHGSVRECIHRATGMRYAVKSIHKQASDIGATGLSREIMLLQEMKHRGFVQLVDVHEDEEYVHLVTELCRGGELFDRIMQKGSNRNNGSPCFTESEAARLMYQLLHAVAYMHENDVAHRDIKPENILFETTDEDSPIRIIDFGLSRKHYDCEPPMNNVVGTPYYIAPEVLRKSYTKSADLWSVGVIAYILLCGYPPFNGEDNNAVYDAVRRGRYSFPSAEWSGTSRESRHFIRCLLQKDPQKRMSAMQALKHPWIVKHVGNKEIEDNRQDSASVEVVYDQQSERESVIMIADS
jgi:serine/threonine protein kinase